MTVYLQKLPAAGPEREMLREKGQFWTPDWIAQAMVAYVLADGADEIFDPAVGAGVFFKAAKQYAHENNRLITLKGTEIDPEPLMMAEMSGLYDNDLKGVQIRDFVLTPHEGRLKAVVANPPYIRHHRLNNDTKQALKTLAGRLIGSPLDGRAGLHIYFLIRALELLTDNGRLAFIMPADTCEGVFASKLWRWVTRNFHLEAVVTFRSEATPFPGVDTNPIIFLIQNQKPESQFFWVECTQSNTDDLQHSILSAFQTGDYPSLVIHRRAIAEGLSTGLSRPPHNAAANELTLGDFGKVLRGIATGANEHFFFTAHQARELDFPDEFLRRAIGRTRDVDGEEITEATLETLDKKGRPTYLFSPDGRSINLFPESVQRYLEQLEIDKVHERALIASRNPWYKMEVREVPPILFAYLGRRNARFIRNYAGVLPLTGFLCVYPYQTDLGYIDQLWQVLKHPQTIANLARVGKSYGGNAIKVEPRALEKLPLPEDVCQKVGLAPIMSRLL